MKQGQRKLFFLLFCIVLFVCVLFTSNSSIISNYSVNVPIIKSRFAESKVQKQNLIKNMRQSQKRMEETYTIVISTYDRDDYLIFHIDSWLRCPNVNQVHVVWHDPEREVPSYMKALVEEYKCSENKTSSIGKGYMCQNCEYCSDERLVIRQQKTDNLNNRFRKPSGGFETEAIFTADDDFVVDCRKMEHAFSQWKKLGKYALVGFEPRIYNWNKRGSGYTWTRPCEEGHCNYNTMFATKGGFLHSMFYDFYFEEQFSQVVEYISEHITGEDMLMCFVHYAKTMQLTGKPPPILNVQQDPDFSPYLIKTAHRLQFFQKQGLKKSREQRHQEEDQKPLKKFQNEGNGIELSGRTPMFRPIVTEMIGELSNSIFGPETIIPLQDTWHFVRNDGSYYTATADTLCGDEILRENLKCTVEGKIRVH